MQLQFAGFWRGSKQKWLVAYVLDNVRDQPYYRTRNDSSASWNVRGWGHYDSEDNGEPYKVPEDQYLTPFLLRFGLEWHG